MEYKEYLIRDIIQLNYGKSLPKAKRNEGEFPVYGSGGITGYHNEFLVEGPSIIVGRKGTVGSLFYEERNFFPIDTTYYVLPSSEYDLKYLYYLFQTIGLDKMNTHSAVPGLNRDGVYAKKILLPSIFYQKKVSHFISLLERKIELNNQMIDTLEEMASTLFKRWFVDFEFPDENGNPYKSSGGKMIDSELGEIPEGWRTGKLSDYGDVVGGGTPSKKKQEYYDNGTVSWITPKDLSELKVMFIEKGKLSITEEALKKSSAKLVPKDTVLFSSRAPIGYMAIAKNSLTTNQGFKSIVPNDSMSSFFIYLWLKRNLEMIKSLGTGSTFKEVSGGTMKNIDTIIPKSKIVSQFDEIIVPVFKLIERCESENSSLIDTRDTLLPKLLSGEIEF